MKYTKEVKEDVRINRLSYREAFEKYHMNPQYWRRIVKDTRPKKEVKERIGVYRSRTTKEIPFMINSSEEVYPFGLYPKAKYEVYNNGKLVYSFVTTIHDEEKCKKLLMEKMEERVFAFYVARIPLMYKIVDGVKTRIYEN